jgi:hypothetical protein
MTVRPCGRYLLISASAILYSFTAFAAEAPTEPKIAGVSAPVDSSDGDCWSRDQETWTVGFPIRDVDRIGIGYIVEPEPWRLANHYPEHLSPADPLELK